MLCHPGNLQPRERRGGAGAAKSGGGAALGLILHCHLPILLRYLLPGRASRRGGPPLLPATLVAKSRVFSCFRAPSWLLN